MRFKGLLRALPEIAPFVDQPLDKNGLTIEGLAVRGPRAMSAEKSARERQSWNCLGVFGGTF